MKNTKLASQVFVLIPLTVNFIGCGPLNDMKDMKDTTGQMLVQTKEMNQKMNTMQEMNKTTKTMSDEMKLLRTDMKDMSTKLDETVKEIKAMAKQMENMQTKLTAMNTTMDSMAVKLGNTVDAIEKMDKRLIKMGQDIEIMNRSMSGKGGMAENLENTVKAMGDMHKSLKETLVVMKNMSADATLGLSTILVTEAFKHLTEVKDPFSAKLVTAGEYAAAQTFQFLRNNKEEDIKEYRDHLYVTGLNTFFGHFKSLMYNGMVDEKPPKESDTPKEENQNKVYNAYALAFRISEINPNQKVTAKNENWGITTLYSVIKEGLALHKKSQTEYQPKSPEWLQSISRNMEVIQTIFQLRYTIMTLKAVSMLANIESAVMEIMKSKVGFGKAITPIKYPVDPGLIETTNKILGAALDARAELEKMGAPVVDVKLVPLTGPSISTLMKSLQIDAPQNIPDGLKPEIEKMHHYLTALQAYYIKSEAK